MLLRKFTAFLHWISPCYCKPFFLLGSISPISVFVCFIGVLILANNIEMSRVRKSSAKPLSKANHPIWCICFFKNRFQILGVKECEIWQIKKMLPNFIINLERKWVGGKAKTKIYTFWQGLKLHLPTNCRMLQSNHTIRKLTNQLVVVRMLNQSSVDRSRRKEETSKSVSRLTFSMSMKLLWKNNFRIWWNSAWRSRRERKPLSWSSGKHKLPTVKDLSTFKEINF